MRVMHAAVSSSSVASSLALFSALGCAHAIAPATIAFEPTQLDGARAPQQVGDEIAASVDAVVMGTKNADPIGPHAGNAGRFDAVKARARELGLGANLTTEAIDWLSLQHNTLIEIPGSGVDGGIIYVVAHVDRIDINPLALPNILLNGMLDPIFEWSYASEGAVDNGTGVAVSLELARAAHEHPLRHTLRVLLPGAEEVGLRGSRAHAARLSDAEWARLAYVVNIDSAGIVGSGDCVYPDVSDHALVQAAHAAAKDVGVELGDASMPSAASSDYESFANVGFVSDFGRSALFNLTGALIPQRSYFAHEHHARVVNFSACETLDVGDIAAGLVLLPLGTFHGPRDNRDHVDRARLYATYRAVLALLRATDSWP